MTDRDTISKVVESLFEDWIDKNRNEHPLAIENMRLLEADALALLKEQEAEIRQLRLALDIVKGTCKGIVVETDEKFMGDL